MKKELNQNVKLVEHDLKSYGQNIKTPEISQICRKETISDKKLEYFVKSMATAGKKYSTYREYPKVCVNLQTDVR